VYITDDAFWVVGFVVPLAKLKTNIPHYPGEAGLKNSCLVFFPREQVRIIRSASS
jgi:hypothetical protein